MLLTVLIIGAALAACAYFSYSARLMSCASDFYVHEAPGEVWDWVARSVAPFVRRAGYDVSDQAADARSYQRVYRAPLTWFFAITTFPVGILIFLAFRRTSTFTIRVAETGNGGSRVTITGNASRDIVNHISRVRGAHPVAGRPRIAQPRVAQP